MKKYRFIHVALIALMLVAGFVIWIVLRDTVENERLRVTWRETGHPIVVSGRVTNESGEPITDLLVDLTTSSGDNPVTTDGNGGFSTNVGERELLSIDADSLGFIKFLGPIGISTENGLWMDIVVKGAK